MLDQCIDDRLRIVAVTRPLAIAGAVTLVAATLFVMGVTSPPVRWPMAAMGTLAAVFRHVPTAAQMLHAPTFLVGGLAGGAVFTLMMYLNFASVVKITTENLTAMMAFSPATA